MAGAGSRTKEERRSHSERRSQEVGRLSQKPKQAYLLTLSAVPGIPLAVCCSSVARPGMSGAVGRYPAPGAAGGRAVHASRPSGGGGGAARALGRDRRARRPVRLRAVRQRGYHVAEQGRVHRQGRRGLRAGARSVRRASEGVAEQRRGGGRADPEPDRDLRERAAARSARSTLRQRRRRRSTATWWRASRESACSSRAWRRRRSGTRAPTPRPRPRLPPARSVA